MVLYGEDREALRQQTREQRCASSTYSSAFEGIGDPMAALIVYVGVGKGDVRGFLFVSKRF